MSAEAYEINFHKESIVSTDFGKLYRLVCIFSSSPKFEIESARLMMRSTSQTKNR
jgi:hypothetical protein